MRSLSISVLLTSLIAIATGQWSLVASHQPKPEVCSNQDLLKSLSRYRGKELRKLEKDDAAKLKEIITKIVPKRTYRDTYDFLPWHLWEFRNKNEQPFFILFEVYDSGFHPGSTFIRITEFDQAGKALEETTFDTAWRCYLRGVKLETTLLDGEYPIIILGTGPGPGPGGDLYKQYYAKVGSNYQLIRLEDYSGKATRNTYYIRHFRSGPALPKQKEQEWISDLLAKEQSRLLRALAWLGGIHYEYKKGDKPGKQEETLEDATLVRKVRENPKVKARLKELIDSEDKWIREAAVLASNPKDIPFYQK